MQVRTRLNFSLLRLAAYRVMTDENEEIDDLMNDIGDVVDENYTKDISGKEHNRVLGGYKATLKSELLVYLMATYPRESHTYPLGIDPRVSGEAKQHAQDKLDEFI